MANRSELAILDQAIAAQPKNTKLYGKRCTARIELRLYAEALEDAKALVRLLPEAPVGYLKAARCYRLLGKLQASQRMLDMATRHAADEDTIRAVRTELRRLNASKAAVAAEKSRTFAEQLPEEIFLEIISYLKQTDRIHAAQVNQLWRTVLHSHPAIWDTMFVNLHPVAVKSGRAKALAFRCQLAFYRERLSIKEEFNSLKNISFHFNSTLQSVGGQVMAMISGLFLQHDPLVAKLEAISVSNLTQGVALDFLKALEKYLPTTLRAIRFSVLGGAEIASDIIEVRAQYPRLEVLECYADGKSAQLDPLWPYLGKSTPSNTSTTVGLGRLVDPIFWNMQAVADPESMPTASINDEIAIVPVSWIADLQHISLACPVTAGFFLTSGSLDRLRSLRLDGVLLAVSFRCSPESMSSWLAKEDLDRILGIELSLPSLQELRLVCSKAGASGNPARTVTRPSMVLCRLDAPRLRHLYIEEYASIQGSASTRDLHEQEIDAFSKFAKRHRNLRTLRLAKTNCPELEEYLDQFPDLTSLYLSHAELSSTFLRKASSPNLPHLQALALPFCTKVGNGDLLRLVQSKEGQLRSLDIEGCTELQKEAVDWLRTKISSVNFKGWRNRDEPRLFGLR